MKIKGWATRGGGLRKRTRKAGSFPPPFSRPGANPFASLWPESAQLHGDWLTSGFLTLAFRNHFPMKRNEPAHVVAHRHCSGSESLGA